MNVDFDSDMQGLLHSQLDIALAESELVPGMPTYRSIGEMS